MHISCSPIRLQRLLSVAPSSGSLPFCHLFRRNIFVINLMIRRLHTCMLVEGPDLSILFFSSWLRAYICIAPFYYVIKQLLCLQLLSVAELLTPSSALFYSQQSSHQFLRPAVVINAQDSLSNDPLHPINRGQVASKRNSSDKQRNISGMDPMECMEAAVTPTSYTKVQSTDDDSWCDAIGSLFIDFQ